MAADLTVQKMYQMYKTKNDNPVSFSLYYSVFNAMDVKFCRLKKDMCTLCDTYHKAPNKGNSFTKNMKFILKKRPR